MVLQGDDKTVLRQCYEGVERDGEVIRVRDTVLLRSGPRKKTLPYVAKISALWEDPRTGEGIIIHTFNLRNTQNNIFFNRNVLFLSLVVVNKVLCLSVHDLTWLFDSGELMMSLFWYYRPEHTQGGRDPSMHCEVSHCFQLDTRVMFTLT